MGVVDGSSREENTDELRICIDPSDLNQALMRPHHALKTVDDILTVMSSATVFSKLDAKSGFWHIELRRKVKILHYIQYSVWSKQIPQNA